MALALRGIIPAMLTPFTQGGERVDFDKAADFATYLADGGAGGLFVCGTTGEGLLMTVEERKKLLETVVEAVGKRIPVIAHTGALDTPTTLELTRHAAASEARAAGVVAPGYYPYDEMALAQFYRSVAEAVPTFPILLYDIPSCTHNPLPAAFIVEMAREVENIAGVKDSSGNMGHLNELLVNAPADFQVINGADVFGYQAFQSGTKAAVSGSANVTLPFYKAVYDHVQANDHEKAWEAMKRLLPACLLFKHSQRIAASKECLRLRGVDAGYVRPPQRELTETEKQQLAVDAEKVGLI